MSEVENEMREIEVSIDEAKKTVEKGKILRRLMTNPDWVALIEEDYLREEAVRLTHLLDHPNEHLQAKQHLIMADQRGISALKRYLHTTLQLADQAEDQIIAFENELEDLRAEEYQPTDGGLQ